jgi:[ribosomal protein S5]-alanine N-acetyltransferase
MHSEMKPTDAGWVGNKIRLVALDKSRHLENVMRWVNDPAGTEHTIVGDFPLGRLAEEEWFDKATRTPDLNPADITFAIETLAGEHVGVSGLHKIEWRNGVALTGTLIGRAHWSKGYATDAAIVRTRYAFDVLGLRILLSEVMSGNEASIKALTKAGYKQYGVIPNRSWKRGVYRDVILLMARRETPKE